MLKERDRDNPLTTRIGSSSPGTRDNYSIHIIIILIIHGKRGNMVRDRRKHKIKARYKERTKQNKAKYEKLY